MSQKERVLHWLESGRTLTPKDAYFNKMGMRLSGIIHTLRNDGWDIVNLNETGEDRWARYKLVPKK